MNYDGKVIISTALDNSGLEKGVNSISGSLGGLKSVVTKTVAVIGTALAAASVALTKEGVEAYAEYEQLVGGVETLFKDSADKLIQYAEDAFYTATLSANQYMSTVTSFSASLISSLGGDTARAADIANMALIDMADNANKMGTEMSLIQSAYQGFAKQNYTMLDNLKLGYGGTKTEMQRLLKDAQAITGIKYDIDNLADVYKAIHEIQKKLGIAGATAKEAEETISGSAAMMKAAWKNTVAAIAGGGDLDRAMNNLVYSVKKYFQNIVPVVQRSLAGIGELIEEIAPKLVESVAIELIKAIPNLLNAVYQMVVGLANGIYRGIVALFTGNTMTSEVTAQLNNVAASAGSAADAEQDLADGIEAAGKAAKKTMAGFDELNILQDKNSAANTDLAGDSVLGGASATVNVKDVVEETQDAVSWLQPIQDKLEELKRGFTDSFKADIPELKKNWKKLSNGIVGVFEDPKVKDSIDNFEKDASYAMGNVTGAVSSVAVSLSTGVTGGASTAAEKMKEFNEVKVTDIAGNLSNIAGSVSNISQAISNIGSAFESESFKGISEFVAMLADWAVMEGLETLTGFFSDKVAMVTKPIADNSDKIKDAIEKIFKIVDLLLQPAKDLLGIAVENSESYQDSAIHALFTELTNLISAGLGGALDEINHQLDGMIELIGGEIDFNQWFEKYVKPAFSVEKWEGTINNIKTAFNTSWERFQKSFEESALGKLWAKVTEFFSKENWEGIMDDAGSGIVDGFKEAINGAIDVMNKFISWVNNRLNFNIPSFEIAGQKLWNSQAVKLATIPKIPHLAQGAVLPANKPFMAVVGDQRHGTNVEAPLATIQEAMANVLADFQAGNMAGHEAVVQRLERLISAVEQIEVGDAVIGQAAQRYNRKQAVIYGGSY